MSAISQWKKVLVQTVSCAVKFFAVLIFEIIVSVQVLFIPNSRVFFLKNAVKFIGDSKYICSIKKMTVMQG